MPIPEERLKALQQKILSERAQAAPQSTGGFSPYPGLELKGMTFGGTRPTVRYGTQETESPKPDSSILEQQQLSGENFSDILSRLRTGFAKAQTVPRGPQAVASGLYRTAKGAAQLDPDASVYYGLREATLGQAARVISAERGVMTNQDLNRVKAAIPTLTTSVETGTKQFDELEGIMVDVVGNAINKGRRNRKEPQLSPQAIESLLGLQSTQKDDPLGLR